MKLITRTICAAAICAVATATLTLCVGKEHRISKEDGFSLCLEQPDAWQGIALEPDGKASINKHGHTRHHPDTHGQSKATASYSEAKA